MSQRQRLDRKVKCYHIVCFCGKSQLSQFNFKAWISILISISSYIALWSVKLMNVPCYFYFLYRFGDFIKANERTSIINPSWVINRANLFYEQHLIPQPQLTVTTFPKSIQSHFPPVVQLKFLFYNTALCTGLFHILVISFFFSAAWTIDIYMVSRNRCFWPEIYSTCVGRYRHFITKWT